jgi:hypothetical protein
VTNLIPQKLELKKLNFKMQVSSQITLFDLKKLFMGLLQKKLTSLNYQVILKENK